MQWQDGAPTHPRPATTSERERERERDVDGAHAASTNAGGYRQLQRLQNEARFVDDQVLHLSDSLFMNLKQVIALATTYGAAAAAPPSGSACGRGTRRAPRAAATSLSDVSLLRFSSRAPRSEVMPHRATARVRGSARAITID